MPAIRSLRIVLDDRPPHLFAMARWNRTSLAAKKHEEIDCRDGCCQSAYSITASDKPARRGQHWLEYDPVAFAVLLIGIGFVALIVLTI